MADFLLDNLQVEALWEILTTNRPEIVLLPPDGVLSFTHRLVVELVKDCLTKYHRGQLTSEYLTDLPENIRTLLQQAEKKSQYGDLALIKELAEKVLYVLEGPARSSKRLETPEGDTKDEQNVTEETPDPNTSQPGPSGDLTTETTELADPDSVILEIPEIQEPAGNLMESLIPARKPQMSDYETSKVISSGTFGTVCLVRHKDSQKIFAMKKMAKKNMNTPKQVERAFLERDILTFADCPFVASMLCSFPTRSHLCMVMEYVGGGDCETLLTTRGPLSVPSARLYFAEAVVAVEYLHSYGVVHRDLKPQNLLITPAGHIKVADFGLSKVGVMTPETNTHKESVEDISREFQDREECGTPLYMAPEIILKKGYGRPADWWSMGIILHKFLLGYEPFQGDSITEVYNNIVGGDLNWDWDHAPPIDAQFLISDLLKKNPAERLGTVGAFAIKNDLFLSDLDFDNLLSHKPEYVPQLVSDVDTSLFINHADPDNQMVSEEDTSEDNESLFFQNFTSSSERLSNLRTITTRNNTNNEGPKSPLVCTQASSRNIRTQRKSFPESASDDAITSLPSSSPISDHADADNQMVLDEDTSEDNESLFFQNFTSSSESLSNLCTITTRNTNNEDPKSPLVCSQASSRNIRMQKKSFPESASNDAITILPSSSPISEQEKSENVEKGKKRRGSIFRRILSSCRHGLSRAARLFTCCHRPPRDI